MEEIASQEEEMKDLRQKLYDVEAEINKVKKIKYSLTALENNSKPFIF
jgi:hypothetical protein